MNLPPMLENQDFDDNNLKGFLLTNLDHKNKHPNVLIINDFLLKRVDLFWDSVVLPLRKLNKFDPNKIKWYYEVYKEGIEANKVSKNSFQFLNIDDKCITNIVNFYKNKSFEEYLSLGTSFLSNSYMILSAWYRDQLILQRLQNIYKSDDAYEWILEAEKEEHGLMSKNTFNVPEITEILQNINLIISRRV
jgi:hypothetical protein